MLYLFFHKGLEIMHASSISKISLVSSMLIFGTIGIFVRYIPLPSSIIAFVRGVVGTLFLLLVSIVTGKKISLSAARQKLVFLVISGILIGFNWILLFESYNYTTVAVSTLCYYMQPTFVIIASIFLFKEKLTPKKTVCVILALVGMIFVSGIVENGIPAFAEMRGIICGLGAAILYASVVLINKKTGNDVDSYTKTVVQLFSAAVVILPYILLTEDVSAIKLDTVSLILLGIVGVIHTGFAYFLYFGSMKNLKAQTLAIMSYIDPVTAIILSSLILHEKMSFASAVGAILILGAAIVSELPSKKA